MKHDKDTVEPGLPAEALENSASASMAEPFDEDGDIAGVSLTSSRRILAQAVAKRADITYNEAYKMLDLFLEEIFNSLMRNGNLEIRGFGVFTVVERKGRIGRNPRKPKEEVWIPNRKNVRFTLSPQLRKRLGPQESRPINN